MPISRLSVLSGLGIRPNVSVRLPGEARPLPGSAGLPSLRDLARQVLQLRTSVDGLQRGSGVRNTNALRIQAASVRSDALGLDLAETATVLSSTEEVNTAATSFSPISPSFEGSSTTVPIIGGVYDGDQGNDTLKFRVRRNRGGIVGQDFIQFAIRDGQNRLIERVSFDASDLPGTEKTLSNGLTLTLTAGLVEERDQFFLDVSTDTPTAVDPDKPLGGIGADDPLFDEGFAIAPGLFFVNGARIDVLLSDTLNDVLGKITSSSAGVSAAFDAGSEKVVLTQRTPGFGQDISLTGDTSGLLAATKLDGATPVAGTDGDLDRNLADVGRFSGLVNGKFSLDGVSITVDPSRDSLRDVLERVESLVPEVEAEFREREGRVVLTERSTGRALQIESDTSGLLDALGIEEGRKEPKRSGGGSGEREFERPQDLAPAVRELARSLQPLFDTLFDKRGASQATRIRGDLRESIAGAFEGLVADTERDQLRSGFGIDFSFSDDEGVVRLDRQRLARALERDPEEVAHFLLGEAGQEGGGLLGALDSTLRGVERVLASRLGPTDGVGLLLDRSA